MARLNDILKRRCRAWRGGRESNCAGHIFVFLAALLLAPLAALHAADESPIVGAIRWDAWYGAGGATKAVEASLGHPCTPLHRPKESIQPGQVQTDENLTPRARPRRSVRVAGRGVRRTGPVRETKLEPARFLGAVKATFDLLTTTMFFGLPWDIYAEFHASVCFPAKTRGRRSGMFSKSFA